MTEITAIDRNVYILKDRAGCCANLVTGRDKALVFDTGSGTDDIYGAVRSITQLPLIVINSHGHFDHIGGNRRFDTVYLHGDDFPILEMYTGEMLEQWRNDLAPGRADVFPCPGPLKWDNMKVLDFDTFDLGGMECRIIPLKGHTKGSVGVWIPSLELLLSGDALTPVMCLIFQNHMTAQVQYETLESVQGLAFERYLTSHHSRSFPRSTIERLLRCIENSRNAKSHDYRYPYPPYGRGRIYVDSVEEEPVALIV